MTTWLAQASAFSSNYYSHLQFLLCSVLFIMDFETSLLLLLLHCFFSREKKEFVMHFRAFGKHSKNVIWGGTNQKNIREKLEWSKSGVSILNGWSHQNTLDHFSSAKNTQYTTSAFAIIASICNFGAVIFRVAKGYKMGFINCWKERFAESIDLIKLL